MLLPLIIRELNVAARRRSTLWLRLGAGGGTMALAVWAIMVWGSSAAFSGTVLFYAMCGIADAAVIFAGFFLAIDAISRERRDGTLPLLYLTDLSVWDIVFGKLAAIAAVPLLSVLSVFPSLAVCQLVGGLQSGELWRSLAALLGTLFFCGSATLFVSSIGRERSTVALGAVLLLIVSNPVSLLYRAAASAPARFWASLAGYMLVGMVFLIATAIVLQGTWRESAQEEQTRQDRLQRNRCGRASLEQFPITWMMFRRWPTQRVAHWGVAVCLIGLGAVVAMQIAARAHLIFALVLLFALHLALLGSILARTAYGFFNYKQEGSFEVLMSAPLTNDDIFFGFARFLHLYSFRLLVLLTGYDALVSGLLWLKGIPQLAAFPLTMVTVLWISFYGVRWLGVYRSLMVHTPLFSALATFWRISFFPMILSALFLWAPRTNYFKVCTFWVISTGFLTLFFANDARRIVLERGRELLLRPSCEKAPSIESRWSFINWEDINESPER